MTATLSAKVTILCTKRIASKPIARVPYLSIDFNGKEDLVGINRTNDQASDVESCLCAFLLNPIHTLLYIDVVRSLERPSQIRRVEAIIQYERAYAMIQKSMKEAYMQ